MSMSDLKIAESVELVAAEFKTLKNKFETPTRVIEGMMAIETIIRMLRNNLGIHVWVRTQQTTAGKKREIVYIGEIKWFKEGQEWYTRTKNFSDYEECVIFATREAINKIRNDESNKD